MKSYFEGNGTFGTKMHMIQYFDGFRIREISVTTLGGKVIWAERYITGILEEGMDYMAVRRRIEADERKAMQRVG